VRELFDLSASANLEDPSALISLPVLSENEMKQKSVLLPRLRFARCELDLSSSDNLMAPSLPILLPVLSEKETKQQGLLL
jgi:hypothetical protein